MREVPLGSDGSDELPTAGWRRAGSSSSRTRTLQTLAQLRRSLKFMSRKTARIRELSQATESSSPLTAGELMNLLEFFHHIISQQSRKLVQV